MGSLHMQRLFGLQAIGNIRDENGFGYQAIGQDLQSPMPFGFPAIGNREEEVGSGFPDNGNIADNN
jgi:hypothetical protein